jgi:regulator of protease activity HflC (stomatin/prohibitin superfamily)
MEVLVIPVLALLAALGVSGVKVTSSSSSRLVERLGKYDRELGPGLSLVVPGLERVVSHESLKERVLDIPPQQCITRDNVSIEVDAVVYWQLLEHSRAYYAVDNLQAAMVNVVLTQIRAEMGKLDLDQTFTTRSEINEVLLKELDQATDPWGVKVTRVELRDIKPSLGVQQAMEQQMTAEREKRAAILRSEGEREAQVNAARGRAEALVLDARAKQEALLLEADARAQQQKLMAGARAEAASELARVIEAHPAAAEGLRLLLAGDWIGMGQELVKAPGGSVLMVDPQSPASLLAALRGLQNGSAEGAAAKPSAQERSSLQPPHTRAEA